MSDALLERGLPASPDAERYVLGAILLDDAAFTRMGRLTAADFSLEKHRRIFQRMTELHERGEKIDRVTVAHELIMHEQLESVDGLTYINSLDEGMPELVHPESYVRIVREKAAQRRVMLTCNRIMSRAAEQDTPAHELAAEAVEAFLKTETPGRDSDLLSLSDTVDLESGGWNAFLDPTKRPQGIKTGFTKFDEMTGGLRAGELIILAARPAMGKTALSINVAYNIAVRKPSSPVAVFCLEMSRQALFTRMICAAARVDSQKFRLNYINADERHALARASHEISQAPVFIDDSAELTLLDIHNKLRRIKAERGLGLAIIDYLQLMASRGKHENRNQEVSALSRGLKLMARELGVPILALSQLSRDPEKRTGDHRPQLSDLRDSGGIEADADIVAFLFREEVYKTDRADLKGLAELLIAKQRQGPIGKIRLVFRPALTKFENCLDDVRQPEDY